MDLLLALAIVVLLTGAVLAISRPFFSDGPSAADRDDRLAELELRKQAKYAEIRDAEVDCRSGKLSEEDFKRLDGELRAEGVEILRQIDKLQDVGEVGSGSR